MRAFGLGLLFVGACTGSASVEPPDGAVGVTWHKDVRPVVEASCVDCHQAGGIGPLSFDAPDVSFASGAPSWAAAMVGAVQSRKMPPWHASAECHPIAGSRALTDAQIAVFQAWADDGYAEGDEADYVAPTVETPEDLGTPDLHLDAGADYTASTRITDDYRCLPLGPALSEDLFVKAINVVPDQAAVVHHVIVYLVHPERAAEVQSLDDADPAIGYPCFGGPIESDPGLTATTFDNLSTWAPGYLAERLPDGEARKLPAGSRLVIQVHYNTLFLPDGQGAPPDRTSVDLWEFPRGVAPAALISTIALPNYDIPIPAGDPRSEHVLDFNFKAAATVVGAMGHMHQLGSSLRVDVRHPDDSTDCVLDIPTWDFNWQQAYSFPTDQPYALGADDTVSLTCVYDNSPGNQAVVDGVQLAPRDVNWGDGTLDEMCLAYAVVRSPNVDDPGTCDAFEGCYASCDPGDQVCVGTCIRDHIDNCMICGLTELRACGTRTCAAETTTLDACLDTCVADDLVCLAGQCQPATLALLDCLDPFVRDGTCDAELSTCGIAL
jgi:hypothetical protein